MSKFNKGDKVKVVRETKAQGGKVYSAGTKGVYVGSYPHKAYFDDDKPDGFYSNIDFGPYGRNVTVREEDVELDIPGKETKYKLDAVVGIYDNPRKIFGKYVRSGESYKEISGASVGKNSVTLYGVFGQTVAYIVSGQTVEIYVVDNSVPVGTIMRNKANLETALRTKRGWKIVSTYNTSLDYAPEYKFSENWEIVYEPVS